MQKIIEAKNIDLYDVLAHVAFAEPEQVRLVFVGFQRHLHEAPARSP